YGRASRSKRSPRCSGVSVSIPSDPSRCSPDTSRTPSALPSAGWLASAGRGRQVLAALIDWRLLPQSSSRPTPQREPPFPAPVQSIPPLAEPGQPRTSPAQRETLSTRWGPSLRTLLTSVDTG